MIVYAIHHLKGGVGKTATAVNLAWLSAREGQRTLLVDLDPQAAASFHLQTAPRVAKGARKLVRGKRTLGELARETAYDFLDVVASDASWRELDPLLEGCRDGTERLAQLLRPLERDYDRVFLDCPPGLTRVAEAAYRAADVVLAPTVPTPLSLRALAAQMKWMRKTLARRPSVLPFFCLVDRRKRLHRDTRAWALEQPLGFLAVSVPYASDVERMGVRRAPLATFARTSEAALAYEDLWHGIQRARLSALPSQGRPRGEAGQVPWRSVP